MVWDFSNFPNFGLIFLPLIIALVIVQQRSPRKLGLPPGPPGWPVIGNMLDLAGSMPHRTLAALKQQYGPVIWLKLASKRTMVILTTKAATELFKNHDLDFADRSIIEAVRVHGYYKSSMVFAPYGTYWRLLRRLVTVDMLVNKRLNESAGLRQRCVGDMLSWIGRESASGEAKRRTGIHVAHFVFFGAFNIMGNVILSCDMVDTHSDEVTSDIHKAMHAIAEVAGIPNISDFIPLLRCFDLQRVKRKMHSAMATAFDIFGKYVEERMREREQESGARKRMDFLEVLLDYEGSGQDEPDKLSKHDICIFILEIFMGGTETTSSTTEWGLTELLCNPETMIKARAELSKVVGSNRKFQESDIDNLPYLQAVVKETLRLHPPGPFLVPRRAISENTNFMGYNIPRNTEVLVNAWAIGRDPDCWDEPSSFKPERFLSSTSTTVDYKGQNFQMIPFGGGRRICPGIPLAQRILPLMLGSLIHEFEWELEENVSGETMDMREKLGMAVTKLEPLKAIPRRTSV